ncbi:heme-binding protein soul2 [Aulostomus maculatus]
MERCTLYVFLALSLVSFCKGNTWEPPEFCHQQDCPEFQEFEGNQDFKTRMYVATEWITTRVASKGNNDMIAAHSRLKNYFKDNGISDNTWPVLITNTNDSELSLSWFVLHRPTTLTNDLSVTLQSRPASKVYVRVFNGMPSVQSGQENARLLHDALTEAGKTFDHTTYIGAGYDPLMSLTHHNEIWIYSA